MTVRTKSKLGNLVVAAKQEKPLNKVFLQDVMTSIEMNDEKHSRKPSQWYKPSSFVCLRQMYYMRIGQEPEVKHTDYNAIGMADTGSRRHEAIQESLMAMEELGFDWRYLDVETYVRSRQKQGRLLDIEIVGKRGAETKLFHKTLCISFMCDGIIQRISTGDCYLFEFKNQVSFKFRDKAAVDKEHIDQVSTYCMALDLTLCFVMYENRDVLTLECPELFEVTPAMKQRQVDKILECEHYVETMEVPPVYEKLKVCKYCKYEKACKAAGMQRRS